MCGTKVTAITNVQVQDRCAVHLLQAGVRRGGYGHQQHWRQQRARGRASLPIARGISSPPAVSVEAEVVRMFSLVGMGYWNSVRLGTLTVQRNVANAERARDDRCLMRLFEHLTATADGEVVRLERLEEVACGSMGPMLRGIINGNWSNLSAALRSHLKDRGVSKLAHSIKRLQVKKTEKGWVMWSDEPLSFETNTPYAAGSDAAWGAGKQSSIGHTTMLLHAIDDFALDADSLDSMSREVDELTEQMRAEAGPPTQSAAAGQQW